MCDWKVFTVMLVLDQPTIFVESSPVPLVAHPNKFIEIGILIVYSPFNVSVFWVLYTHCLYGQQYPCDRAFSFAGISLLRFIVRGNHNCICCTLRPVRASHKSGKISRPHGHHSSHSIGDVYWQSEALSHSI